MYVLVTTEEQITEVEQNYFGSMLTFLLLMFSICICDLLNPSPLMDYIVEK